MVDRRKSASLNREVVALVLIMLFGSALRAYRVAHFAFSGDEGFSFSVSARPLSDILTLMAHSEPHPPLHFLFLKAWVPIVGNSELGVRWPWVLVGVLTIAFTYRLGCVLVGRSTGRLAALFAAFSPFLVWHSQDGRMYSFLPALVLAATWQAWRAAQYNRLRHWITTGLLWTLALSTHYFAALPFLVVTGTLLFSPRPHLRWRQGMALALGVGVAYLPWIVFVGSGLVGHTKDWLPSQALWRFLAAFSVGTKSAGATYALQWFGVGLLSLLLISGAVVLLRRKPDAAMWTLTLALGVPGLFWMLTLLRPVFVERYTISILPVVLMVAAVGISELTRVRPWGRWLSWAVTAGWALAALISLQNYFFNLAYAKSPDWHRVVAYLAETARSHEVVVLNLPDPAFFLYYRGPMPVEVSPPAELARAGRLATEAQLRRLRDDFQHIRFFFSPSPAYDPEGFVGNWLEACCEKTSDIFVSGFRVQSFDTPSGSLAARLSYPARFERGISLMGYRVINPTVRAGESLRLTLFWVASAPIESSYTVFIHVLAADGFDVLDADGLPRNGAQPTDQWTVGEIVIDPHLILIPADMPPDHYRLDIGLYLLGTGERLRAVDASGTTTDHVLLPVSVRVESP